MLYVEALGWGSRSQNPVHAARSRLASFRAIFHIKSDSAMFDNIAVLIGSGSSYRVLAPCGIGPFSLSWHITNCGTPAVNKPQKICQAGNDLKTPWFFFAFHAICKFFRRIRFPELTRRSCGSGREPESAMASPTDEPTVSTNLQ